MTQRTTRGWIAFGTATTAVALAAAFTYVVLTMPMYNTGETTLEVNTGLWFQIVIGIPLGACLLTWLVLHFACRRDSRRLKSVGLNLAALLFLFAVISGFSIGLLFMPAAAALVLAAALTPVRD